MHTFHVTFALTDIGKYDTLKDACKALYQVVMHAAENGRLTEMGLFEATWITEHAGSRFCRLINFSAIQKEVTDNKWVNEGQWVAA